jgi:hypothetical protein
MVSKWEAGGTNIVPRPFSQALLDTCLQHADALEQERFARLRAEPAQTVAPVPGPPLEASLVPPPARPALVPREPAATIVERTLARDDMRTALAARNIAGVYRILGRHGVSQRRIAAMTGQSQSEISEILRGRRVVSYDVLVRIADGLGIPRGYMGLAYCQGAADALRCAAAARPAVDDTRGTR